MKNLFLLSVLFLLFSCDSQSVNSSGSGSQNNSTIEKPLKADFKQIGYFKGDDRLRYFTFFVDYPKEVNRDSIPSDLLNQIKSHGSKQQNTAGKVTASFYYLDLGSTPDITNYNANRANDIAHEKKPIASVWIMPNGSINVFQNPQ